MFSLSLRALARFWALACLLGLVGCGGGGGGGGLTVTLTSTTTPLLASYLRSQLPHQPVVLAALSGNIPPGTLRMNLVDSGNVFSTTSFSVTGLGNNQYAINVWIPETAAAGVHTGTLTLQVCDDQRCQKLFGSGSLPYNITIQAPTVTATPNLSAVSALQKVGVPLAFSAQNMPSDSVPYAVLAQGDATFPAQTVPLEQVAPGDYQGFLALQPGLSPTSYAGTISSLKFCGDAACQSLYGSYSNLPYTLQVLSMVAGGVGQGYTADGNGVNAAFDSPAGIVLNGSGNLVVEDEGNDNIRLVTPSGDVSTVFYGGASGQTQYAMNGALALDRAGNIYFTNNQYIEQLTPQGVVNQYVNTNASGCSGMATDSQGNLYCDALDGDPPQYSLTEFAPGGVFQQMVPVADAPYGGPLAVDVAGNVYMGSGNLVMRLLPGTPQTLASNFVNVQGLATDSAGNLFVTDSGTGVTRIAPDGTQKVVVPPGAMVNSSSGFRPTFVAVAAGGVLYFSDTYNDLIVTTTVP